MAEFLESIIMWPDTLPSDCTSTGPAGYTGYLIHNREKPHQSALFPQNGLLCNIEVKTIQHRQWLGNASVSYNHQRKDRRSLSIFGS